MILLPLSPRAPLTPQAAPSTMSTVPKLTSLNENGYEGNSNTSTLKKSQGRVTVDSPTHDRRGSDVGNEGVSSDSISALYARCLFFPNYGESLLESVLAETHRLHNVPIVSRCDDDEAGNNDDDQEEEEEGGVFSILDWETFAASKIQSTFKMYKTRKQFWQYKRAAERIQNSFRRHEASKNLRALKLTVHQNTYELAVYNYFATVIQAQYRGYLSRRRDYDYYRQKYYIQSVVDAGELLREVAAASIQIDEKQSTAAREEKNASEYESATSKAHHLLSTASVSGVYRRRQEPTSQRTDLGTHVEDDITHNARKARRPQVVEEYQRNSQKPFTTNIDSNRLATTVSASSSARGERDKDSAKLKRSFKKSDRDVIPYAEVYNRDEQVVVSDIHVSDSSTAPAEGGSGGGPITVDQVLKEYKRLSMMDTEQQRRNSAPSSNRQSILHSGGAGSVNSNNNSNSNSISNSPSAGSERPNMASSLPPIRGSLPATDVGARTQPAASANSSSKKDPRAKTYTKTKNMRTGVYTVYGAKPVDEVGSKSYKSSLLPVTAWDNDQALPPQRPVVSKKNGTNINAVDSTTTDADCSDPYKKASSSFKRKFHVGGHDCTTPRITQQQPVQKRTVVAGGQSQPGGSALAVAYPTSYYRNTKEEESGKRSVDHQVAQQLHGETAFKTPRYPGQ